MNCYLLKYLGAKIVKTLGFLFYDALFLPVKFKNFLKFKEVPSIPLLAHHNKLDIASLPLIL